MKKDQRIAVPVIGASSLLVIFAVLCLTVFALLSLNTVMAEKRMADASAQAVAAYYEADLEAEKIFARLRSGETPLLLAAAKGHDDIVAALIAAGADKEATMPTGDTPLMTAAFNGHKDVVRVLLDAKVNA